MLVSRLKDSRAFVAAVARDGRVIVEGEAVGRLDGFRFAPEKGSSDAADKAVAGAALRALMGEARARVQALATDADEAFAFGPELEILWRSAAVARLAPGAAPLAPQIAVPASDLLDGAGRERVRGRLATWVAAAVRGALAPLFAAREADLRGPARGIVYQLAERLGSLPRRAAETEIAALGTNDRRRLRALGIVVGRESVFFPELLKPKAARVRARLFAAARGLATPPPTPAPGRTRIARSAETPADFLEAVGYRIVGPLAVRLDILERIAAGAWTLARKGPFVPPPAMLNPAGCGPDEMAAILAGLGFKETTHDGARAFRPRRRGVPDRPRSSRRGVAIEDSPFAVLKGAVGGRPPR